MDRRQRGPPFTESSTLANSPLKMSNPDQMMHATKNGRHTDRQIEIETN